MASSLRRAGSPMLLLGALVLVVTSACGSGKGAQAPSHAVGVMDQRLHDALPAAVSARGEIRVVTDASYAPASSFVHAMSW